VAAPAPYIVLGTASCALGPQNVAGTTQQVYVGQQMIVTGCGYPPGGYTISSQSWTQPPGTAIGGYNPLAVSPAPQVVTFANANPTLSASSLTFYWVDVGNPRQMTFTYTMNNGQSATAMVTFNVQGPTGVTVVPTPSTVSVVPPPTVLSDTDPVLILGAVNVPGIKFFAQATNMAGGSYVWIQLISTGTFYALGPDGPLAPDVNVPSTPELDGAYPYGYTSAGIALGTVSTAQVTNDTAQDTPWSDLPNDEGEVKFSFKATMYLMWQPNAATGCTSGGACTIPVPQGNITWSFVGDAINTLIPLVHQGVSYSQWVLNVCAPPSVSAYQPGAAFPQWSAVVYPQ